MRKFSFTSILVGFHLLVSSTIFSNEVHSAEDSTEVIEVFLYTCSRCFDVEQLVGQWLIDNNDIELVRVPIVLYPELEELNYWRFARTYYVFEKMDVTERMHALFFEAIHIEKRDLSSKESIVEFVGENGLDANEFKTLFDSVEISELVNSAKEYVSKFNVSETPTFILNNDTVITLDSTDGSISNLFHLIREHLDDA